MSISIAALFKIAKRRKQPKCPSTDEQTNKKYIHTMEHLAIKRIEILTDIATWVDLEKHYAK